MVGSESGGRGLRTEEILRVARSAGWCARVPGLCLKSECSVRWKMCDYRGPVAVGLRQMRGLEKWR